MLARVEGDIAKAEKYFKIAVADVLVICDDVNLDVGKIRLRRQRQTRRMGHVP